jgi:hypothetical protein
MTNKKIEELSINQAMGQLYVKIENLILSLLNDNIHLDKGDKGDKGDDVLSAFHVVEKALTKAQEDNHSKIKEIANILQEPVIKDFKQYN